MKRSQLTHHFLPSQEEERGVPRKAFLMLAPLVFPCVVRAEWEVISSQPWYLEPQSRDSRQIRLLICMINRVNSTH